MSRIWLAPAGALIALVSSLCGIGGGLFAVPLLHFGLRLELRRAVATSLVLVLATSSAATLVEAFRRDSWLHPLLLAVLVPAGLAGTRLGYFVAQAIATRRLRQVFVLVLALVGARVLFSGEGGDGSADAALAVEAFGATHYAIALAIGVVSGFVTPLLGVGGGLVMVPALYLGVPGIGFGVARSASLAVAVFTAASSVWLYWRSGAVDTRAATPLAGGALAGAAAGALLVHEPGWVEIARVLLALVLWGVSVRFALEAWRERNGDAPQLPGR